MFTHPCGDKSRNHMVYCDLITYNTFSLTQQTTRVTTFDYANKGSDRNLDFSNFVYQKRDFLASFSLVARNELDVSKDIDLMNFPWELLLRDLQRLATNEVSY